MLDGHYANAFGESKRFLSALNAYPTLNEYFYNEVLRCIVSIKLKNVVYNPCLIMISGPGLSGKTLHELVCPGKIFK